MEHYHVMFKHELGTDESLGGIVFESFRDAANEFIDRTHKGSPAEVMMLAVMVWRRGMILRDRSHKSAPFTYMAICHRNACNRRCIRMRITAICRTCQPWWATGDEPSIAIQPRSNPDREYYDFQDRHGRTFWV